MSAQSPLPANDPRVIAWNTYKAGEEYENTKRWARHPEHTEGSLWAAFIAGFAAATPEGGRDDGR